MKISELIILLKDAQKQVGDLQVVLASDPECNNIGELSAKRCLGLESYETSGGTLNLSEDDNSDPTHLVILPINTVYVS